MQNRVLGEKLAQRGLEILGPCTRLSDRQEMLRDSPVLHDFTPEEADLLVASMLHVRARPGQLLIAEVEASDWMMMLLKGTVDVRTRKVGAGIDDTAPGDAARLAVIKEGAVIGEMSLLDGGPRYASCRALSQVEAAVLSRASVSYLIEHYPTLGA